MLEMPRLVGAPGSSGEGEEGRKSERVAPPGIGLCSRREPEQSNVLGNITEEAQPKPICDTMSYRYHIHIGRLGQIWSSTCQGLPSEVLVISKIPTKLHKSS